MNSLDQLNAYLRRLESRFRLAALARGSALAAFVALGATVLLVLLADYFAFSERSLIGSRLLLFLSVAFALGFGLVVPLLKLTRPKAARSAERKFPEFEERLLTFAEKEADQRVDPFLELLAADTIDAAEQAEPRRVVADGLIVGFSSAAVVALTVLIWLTFAGPGFMGHGASLLWAGTSRGEAQPFYDIVLEPGNRTVRRGASLPVTARLVGFQSQNVRLFARYRGATKWEEAVMLPKEGISAYEYLFAGIPETVDYYATAGRVRSRTYTLNVIDLPIVKRIRVKYRFPAWTGLGESVEDPGGDLRAVKGTEAEIAVETDRPLSRGTLVVDDGNEVGLGSGEGKWSSGRLKIQRDGVYYIAVREQGELIRLSNDYFIEALEDGAPSLRVVRPGRDARVSPIEEVTVAVEAEDDFGLQQLDLRYSVNGDAEKTVPMLERKGLRRAEGSTVIYLEDFNLVPGDVVALYASARDARASTKTDIYFLEAQPFEREYSQSQQMGGGGGGMGQGNRISQRQKEIIAATWNQLRNTSQDSQSAAENAKFLAEVQSALRDQARSLARRMQRRELSETNQEFQSFSRDMEKAAESMDAAVGQLKKRQWREALPREQKALQHLLRAEATFRQIQVAFGNRGGAGGGSGRDLENLFDLELDTEKNQYETGQQAATTNQRDREIDEALQRLEQLARRQQELAERQRQQQLSSQQRWQQEMLRREAEELQRRMEQLVRGESQSSGEGRQSTAASGGRSQVDPRLEQALRRLEEATRDMRQGASGQSGAESRRAADRLQEARDLMRGLRRQETSERFDDIVRQAEQLAEQQEKSAERLRQLFGNQPEAQSGPILGRRITREQFEQSRELAAEKQRMTEALGRLEREMQDAARDLAGTQPSASGRLRRALGDMQQDELALRMRYNTELLRRGLGPYVWPREAPVTQGLRNLRDQLRDARGTLERSPSGQNDTERALAQVERLRRQLGGLSGVRDFSAMNRGDLLPPEGGVTPRSGASADAAALERLFRESLRDLSRLRPSLEEIPEAAQDMQELIREMQRLDPSRFPGNPELLEQLRTQVLPALEQVELQLRRKLEEQQGGQVRTGATEPIPPGYAEAVAEYFRRLSRQK